MGTAYAVWGGIGAVGTVMVGMVFFDEPTTTLRLLLILGIVGRIAGDGEEMSIGLTAANSKTKKVMKRAVRADCR